MRAYLVALTGMLAMTAAAQEPKKAEEYPLKVTIRWTDKARKKDLTFADLPAKWGKSGTGTPLLVAKVTPAIRTELQRAEGLDKGAVVVIEDGTEKTTRRAESLYFKDKTAVMRVSDKPLDR